jgi:hypothetical protein
MWANTPVFFVGLLVVAVGVIASVGMSLLWGIFAVTLGVTTVVAFIRSIPRRER